MLMARPLLRKMGKVRNQVQDDPQRPPGAFNTYGDPFPLQRRKGGKSSPNLEHSILMARLFLYKMGKVGEVENRDTGRHPKTPKP